VSQIVVSDSTCLIGLERIQRLDLLPAVFDSVWIPPAVAEEFGGALPWLRVKSPANPAIVRAFSVVVDRGEAEAMALAQELGCEVILDDQKARRLAAREHIPHIGLLMVLLRAKDAGKLASVAPVIEALRLQKFFFSESLVMKVLRLADESK
jgi:predicted nucleic acid-binding protein